MSVETQIMTAEEEIKARKEFEDILATFCKHFSEEDLKGIRKAFELALKAHEEQRRQSGEIYIYHPLGVVRILA